MTDKTNNGDIQVVSENGKGKVSFANDVIAVIASLAATEVEGVAGLNTGMISGFVEKLGKKSYTKGVKVEVGTEEVAVDVYLIVNYGVKIHEVSAKVQEAVKKSIENMTGLKVVEVNVYIESVNLPKDDQDKDQEDQNIEQPRVK